MSTSAKRRASALKGHRTRKRMAAAREREQQRRGDELIAEFGQFRLHRFLWPSSYRPSED